MNDKVIDKLELGSGAVPTPGYLHQDIMGIPGIKIEYICNAWEVPLDPNSLSEVIAVGVMEHLRFNDLYRTLKHIFGLLRQGGVFLFDVPDMRVWSEYLYNMTHGKSDKNPFTDEHVWRTIYGWQRFDGDEHKSGWTKEGIIDIVKESGFSEVEEGVEMYASRGIKRRRFDRPGDAHIYIKAIK